MSNIFIVAARRGSRRLPGKNRHLIFDQAAFMYPLKAAYKARLYSKIIISTDDPEIIQYVKKEKWITTHKRSCAFLCGGDSSVIDIVPDVLDDLSLNLKKISSITLSYGTSIFLTAEKLIEAYNFFEKYNQKSMIFSGISCKNGEHEGCVFRHDEKFFLDAAQFYMANIDRFTSKIFWLDAAVAVEYSADSVVDINTKEDMILAKKILDHEKRN
jgi:pseudaminic acid cytidylyltransferase